MIHKDNDQKSLLTIQYQIIFTLVKRIDQEIASIIVKALVICYRKTTLVLIITVIKDQADRKSYK